MRKKIEAHEALSLLFKCDGVPPDRIVSCLREQTLGLLNSSVNKRTVCLDYLSHTCLGWMLKSVVSVSSKMVFIMQNYQITKS